MPEIFPRDMRSQEERREWVRQFESTSTPRAIFGTNRWAESVARLVDVRYFIDDYRNTVEFCGRPVVRLESAEAGVMTLSAAIGRPLSARERLRSRVSSWLDYYSFLKHTTLPVEQIEYLSDDLDWNLGSWARLRAMRDSLHDDESVETFDRVYSLRRDLELEAMVVFADRQSDQYFEPFVRLHSESTFLDVGAYDGFTTVYAQRVFGDELKCHLFEPSLKMFNFLKTRFANKLSVTLYPMGLADRPQRLRFNESGSASRIGIGSSSVEVSSLDHLNFAEVDFIKVDIEGAERMFLDGAEETIRRCKPQLALACYHSNSQFVDVFERARELLPDARVYLRHYTEGFAETDVFFIPPRFW